MRSARRARLARRTRRLHPRFRRWCRGNGYLWNCDADGYRQVFAHRTDDLAAHFARHAPRYGVGVVLLAAYQGAQYWFDTRLRQAINDAIGTEHERAIELGLGLVVVMAPNKYWLRLSAEAPGAFAISTTPPAIPP